ncbi:MAG: lysine exporter LysO family protein [Bacteroidales bacterium]
MKGTLIILLFFIAGLIFGIVDFFPAYLSGDRMTTYVLYALLFFVGIGVGTNKETLYILKTANWRIILIPLSVIVGTFLGTTIYTLFDPSLTLRECWAVGAGYGYYSLSSIIIKEMAGETLGVIALLSNIIREIITLVFTPVLKRYFGFLAPISAGGATTMDTTLPVITKYIGIEYVAFSVFSGLVLTLLVPFIIPFILS